MPSPRWDELDRAIRAKDSDAAERVWLELIETDLASVDGFLKAADGVAERAGGRRQSGVLLSMVAAALKDKGRDRDLLRVYVRLAPIAPDDGTLRQAIVDAARAGFPGRTDLDNLLEKSGIVGGAAPDLAKQAEVLERYLRLEKGAYVFHRTGWGIGRIVDCIPDKGRCVIDFLSKPGHGMDLLAAADMLERLPEDDLRVMAAYKPDDLRKLAVERPLDVLRRAIALQGNDAPLRHIKDALIPNVVAKTAWAAWWKEAKKAATLDPAWTIGPGTDPRLTFTPGGGHDFAGLVERQLSFAKNGEGRRGVLREFQRTAGKEPEAREVLLGHARTFLGQVNVGDIPERLSWSILVGTIEGVDPTKVLAPLIEAHPNPLELLRSLQTDDVRAFATRALFVARPADADEVALAAALEQEIAVADVAADHWLATKRSDLLARLLGPAFDDPPARPLLYAWAVRGLARDRWPGRAADPYKAAEQVLRVLDATAYAARRDPDPHRDSAVNSLSDLLQDRHCRLVVDACSATDVEGARHLLRIVERNRGLKPRPREKLSDAILRSHPDALSESRTETTTEPRIAEIYMTAAGIERTRREYDRIVNDEMPTNAAEIQRAREFGDLSENAEYHAAREKQGLLQARSNALKELLSLSREIRPEIVRTDAVSVGARVRLREESGDEVTYTLLGPADADVSKNVINYQTPLGRSLMGKKPGERVTLELMGATHAYEVLEIAVGV